MRTLLAFLLVAAAACSAEPEPASSTASTPPTTTTVTTSTTTTTTLPPTTSSTQPTTSTTQPEPAEFYRMSGLITARSFIRRFAASGLTRWQRELPEIQDVRVTSTLDGTEQPVLYLPPDGEGLRPLLVGLHSWSSAYRQHVNIPFGKWADHYGWGFIQPNFRGANNRKAAMGSDLAVQDVIDAIDYAIAQGGIDPNRVYVIGFSGGGMIGLLLAGRHPDRIAGAAAWTSTYDLAAFYTRSRSAGSSYYQDIRAVCGGDPTRPGRAQDECKHRSPSGHLDGAKAAGVPVYVAHGISDRLAPPDHSARIFNHLADEPLPDDLVAAIARNRIPSAYDGSIEGETYFHSSEPRVRFARTSGAVTLVLFNGEHNMVYHPALEFFLRLSERPITHPGVFE